MKRAKTVRQSVAIAAAVTALLLAISVLAAMDFFSPSRDEVLRVMSPSGRSVAIVVEVNGGATTSFAYHVQIDHSGLSLGPTTVARFYRPMRNFESFGVTPRWASDNELLIEYFNSRSDEVHSPLTRLFNSPIEVILKPGVFDQSAPRGSMLANLK